MNVEVLCVVDPDGEPTLTVWIDGCRLADELDGELTTYVVDAGHGYEYADWVESIEWAEQHASPEARDTIVNAYGDPPGKDYIDGWPDEEDDDEYEPTAPPPPLPPSIDQHGQHLPTPRDVPPDLLDQGYVTVTDEQGRV